MALNNTYYMLEHPFFYFYMEERKIMWNEAYLLECKTQD